MAQEGSDARAFTGGVDLLELRAGEGDEVSIWDVTLSCGNDTDQVMLTNSGGGALGNQIDRRAPGHQAA